MSTTGRLVAETERLLLREAVVADAGFMYRLLNEPSWRRFIGEHDVATPEDAAVYLVERYLPAYANGFGLWIVTLKADDTPIGVCGLVQRPYLEDLDLGFAFLETYWGGGYAFEAARASIDHAYTRVGVRRLAAITAPGNEASVRLLTKLGFHCAGSIVPPGSREALLLYQLTRGPASC